MPEIEALNRDNISRHPTVLEEIEEEEKSLSIKEPLIKNTTSKV